MTAALGELVRRTFGDPRGTARTLIGFGLSAEVRWLGLAVVSVLSVVIAFLTLEISPYAKTVMGGEITASPLSWVGIEAVTLLVTAFGVFFVGRSFGGTGRMDDALLLIVWIQFVFVLLQLAQLVLMVLFPIAAGVLGILGLGLFFYLLTQFSMELHGFVSPWKVFAMVILGTVVAVFCLSFVLAALQLAAPPGGISNV